MEDRPHDPNLQRTADMTIDNTQDIIDSRDVIARIEQLQAIREPGAVPEGILEDEDYDADQDSLFHELAALEVLAAQGTNITDWQYGTTLIRDSYFTPCPANCLDWDEAPGEPLTDYAEVDFDGVTYWVR